MFATRWNPLTEMQSEMNRLQGEMDQLFGRFGRTGGTNGRTLPAVEYPPLNIWEDDNQLYVEAELPGMELEDLEIYVNGGNQLTVKGERKEPACEGGTWHRRERGYGKFTRMIELPSQVDAEKVEANFKQGVLMVSLPKQEAAKPRRIEVKVE